MKFDYSADPDYEWNVDGGIEQKGIAQYLDLMAFRICDRTTGRFLSVDPLSDIAPNWTGYRMSFNNPINYTDPLGLFESRNEAQAYADEQGIGIGLFRRNKIRQQSDGSYAIVNRKANTFTQDLGGDLGVQTAEVTVSANDVMNTDFIDGNFFNNGSIVESFRDGSSRELPITGGTIAVGGGGASQLTNLGRYITSLSQMAAKGKVIAPSVRDAPRLVAMYGGKAKDWVKVSSKTYREANGFKFATHWYKNVRTGKIVEYKTKIGG